MKPGEKLKPARLFIWTPAMDFFAPRPPSWIPRGTLPTLRLAVSADKTDALGYFRQ